MGQMESNIILSFFLFKSLICGLKFVFSFKILTCVTLPLYAKIVSLKKLPTPTSTYYEPVGKYVFIIN